LFFPLYLAAALGDNFWNALFFAGLGLGFKLANAVAQSWKNNFFELSQGGMHE
jgi:hypothetical protein